MQYITEATKCALQTNQQVKAYQSLSSHSNRARILQARPEEVYIV